MFNPTITNRTSTPQQNYLCWQLKQPGRVLLTGHPTITMSAEKLAALGPGLASRMSMEQLREASLLFNSLSVATTEQNSVSVAMVHHVFMNHLLHCMRMPAGGATARGSQQTGFEMELISAETASRMFNSWPNPESLSQGRRLSWELRTMEDLAKLLALEQAPAGWGAFMGKPMPIMPGKTTHQGVLLAGPPFTVCWRIRPDQTTTLSVRFPLVIWSEEDAAILPPDDADGVAFYADPPDQPGLHRDLLKTWGRRVAGELSIRGLPMSAAVMSHLPREYCSESDSEEAPPTERSVSPPLSMGSIDSSDMEGAHRPQSPDSSDMEGAHR